MLCVVVNIRRRLHIMFTTIRIDMYIRIHDAIVCHALELMITNNVQIRQDPAAQGVSDPV